MFLDKFGRSKLVHLHKTHHCWGTSPLAECALRERGLLGGPRGRASGAHRGCFHTTGPRGQVQAAGTWAPAPALQVQLSSCARPHSLNLAAVPRLSQTGQATALPSTIHRDKARSTFLARCTDRAAHLRQPTFSRTGAGQTGGTPWPVVGELGAAFRSFQQETAQATWLLTCPGKSARC